MGRADRWCRTWRPTVVVDPSPLAGADREGSRTAGPAPSRARAAELRSALDAGGVTTHQLWCEHLHLGADLSLAQVVDALAGRLELSDHEYLVLEQALFEASAVLAADGAGGSSSASSPAQPRGVVQGRVRLVGAERLVCAGSIDTAVVRGFTASDDQLVQVQVVDLTAVTHFDRAALTLVVRCLQQARDGCQDRLRLVGVSTCVRADLELLGVLELVDLHR